MGPMVAGTGGVSVFFDLTRTATANAGGAEQPSDQDMHGRSLSSHVREQYAGGNVVCGH